MAESTLLCDWLYLGKKRFTEPFFEETMTACRNANTKHRRYKILSDLDWMVERSAEMSSIPLTAIVFHVSRCGSTLLSQLLAADEKNIVLSEVPFLDDMLRLPYQRMDIVKAKAADYFKAALAFYGQQRTNGQERLFIKADCWHLHFYEELRIIFPTVPFFLLFRDPMAVLQSQQKQRGIQSVPGMIEPEVLGLTEEQSRDTNLDRYMSNVLTVLFQKMIRITQTDPLAMPLNYADDINYHVKALYRKLQLPLDRTLVESFDQRSRFHAKRPQLTFDEIPVLQSTPLFAEPVCCLYQQLSSLTGVCSSKY
jgi:hypothetical protein